MLTALTATLIALATTIGTAAPQSPSVEPSHGTFTKAATTTLGTAIPTPGACVLMAMGGLALIRSRRSGE